MSSLETSLALTIAWMLAGPVGFGIVLPFAVVMYLKRQQERREKLERVGNPHRA